MHAFLSEGFNDTYRNIGSALRLFWPVLAIMLLGYAISFLLAAAWISENTANDLKLLGMWLVAVFAVLIYVFFIVCQGAVGWHRRVLLNETPGWISLIPRRRAFQYALAVFLFVLMFVIAQMVVGFLLMPLMASWMIPMLQDFDTTGNPVDQLEAAWKIMLPIQIAMFLVSIVVMGGLLWLLRSWLLVFPHISIRSAQPAFGAIKDTLDTPGSLVVALLIVYFLPSLLALVYSGIVPLRMQLVPWVGVTSLIVQLVIAVFSFLWGLSILSKAYAKIAARQIFYEARA